MPLSRRLFLAQSLALMTDPLLTNIALAKSMPHVVLLGDSIFDNAAYTGGKPDVIHQVRAALPSGWKATLLAVDGATTDGISSQLARMPADATHMVLSVGGNNALSQTGVLDMPVKSSAEALLALADVVHRFDIAYRQVVDACLRHRLPLTICTIYNGNFADANFQKRAAVALASWNDAIIRVGVEKQLTMIDLRQVCNQPEDFANPIEPSTIGGAKIAATIIRAVTTTSATHGGAIIIGGH
jgi:hypothetical protein